MLNFDDVSITSSPHKVDVIGFDQLQVLEAYQHVATSGGNLYTDPGALLVESMCNNSVLAIQIASGLQTIQAHNHNADLMKHHKEQGSGNPTTGQSATGPPFRG